MSGPVALQKRVEAEVGSLRRVGVLWKPRPFFWAIFRFGKGLLVVSRAERSSRVVILCNSSFAFVGVKNAHPQQHVKIEDIQK